MWPALGIRQCTEGGIEIGTLGSRGAKAGVEERNDGSNYKKDSVLTLCIKKERAAGGPFLVQSVNWVLKEGEHPFSSGDPRPLENHDRDCL